LNGTENHVHLLASLHPKYSFSDIFRDVKAISSQWIHERFPGELFGWQSGYGAFSVSQSMVPTVEKYVANQAAHHRNQAFEEEFMQLLEKHGIAYDRQYVLD